MKNYPSLMSHLSDVAYAFSMHDYSEPGYSKDDKVGILVGDWNKISTGLMKALEEKFVLEWYDEWTTCEACGGLVRTSPDSYGWSPSYHIFKDSTVLCRACILEDPSSYIDELRNNPNAVDTLGLPLADLGWTEEPETFESGLHSHMNDVPKDIMKGLRKKHPDRDFMFTSFRNSQFYCDYKISWIRKEAN